MVTGPMVTGPMVRARAALKRRSVRRPAVTVIIPTYNWATVLPWSIGSVLAQAFRDFELLVVGDGCTDESAEVVGRIRDPRLRWVNLPTNTGSQVTPNNVGIDLAVGEFIAYLGHDDLWLPNHLSNLVPLAAANSFVIGRQLRIDPGRPPFLLPLDGWTYVPRDWVAPTSVVHRRSAAQSVGGWRFPVEGQAEDAEANLWFRMSERFGPPVIAGAVTSVKLPAAYRKDVYLERPSDEQERWWHRITAAPSTEHFVAQALAETGAVTPDRYTAVGLPPELTGEVATSALHRRAVSRRLKGLPPD